MNPIPKFYLFVLFQILLFGISCQRETIDLNKAPVANAGLDQTIYWPLTSGILDGSKSNDAENAIIGYEWRKIEGPSSFQIINDRAAQTTVLGLVKGTYQFELKVTDQGLLSSRDTVLIIVLISNPPDPAVSMKCDSINRSNIAAKLIPISNGSFPLIAAAAEDKIIFTGYYGSNPIGGQASPKVDLYDINKKTWATTQLSVGRINMAVATSGTKIFLAGGYDEDEHTFNTTYDNIDIYDASSDSWTTAKLSEARHTIVGASIGSKVFFAGGFNTLNLPSNKVDIYNLNSKTWSVTNLPGLPSVDFSITVNDKIYFIGGIGKSTSTKVDIYDNSNGTWSSLDWDLRRISSSGVEVDGKIYMTNGLYGDASKTVDIFDIRSNTFSKSCLSEDNCYSHMVKKGNQILIFPGLCPLPGPGSNNFDIYDVQNGSWSIGHLDLAIIIATVININNEIYIAGGPYYPNGPPGGIWKLEF